ncbi:MAG TPA: TolC family protein [Kofleriaceae bacterium]
MLGRAIVAIVSVGVLARVASAEGGDAYVPPDFMAALPPLPPTVEAAKVWRLSLSEAIQVALHQNLGIVIEREQVQVAKLGVTVAKGAFEPVISGTYDHNRADAPPVTVQEGGANQNISYVTDDWRLTLSDRLETGTIVALDFSNGRARSSAGTAVEPLNYRSTLTLSVTQPLLRGFSPDLVIPRIEILRAKIASERERAQLAVAAADVVQRTEDAYWDVVQALYSYDLQLRSQKRADDQMALTRRQIDAGLMPPSDLIAAESTLADRKLQVLQAEATIDASFDALRSILNLPRDQWARAILPVEPPQFAPSSGSAEEALAIAIKHRPEILQLDLDLQSALLAVRQAENARLPQLDLGVTGALIGQDTTYGDTLNGIGNADAHEYNVVLNFSWTPLMRATRAQAEIAKTQHQVAQVTKDQSVQNIWFEVRDAVRNQLSASRQVFAASKFRQLSTESLEVEQRKFLSNQSTNFVLGQHQDELAAAQLSELTAVLVHKKASAALLKATGKLLDERHITLDVTKPAR